MATVLAELHHLLKRAHAAHPSTSVWTVAYVSVRQVQMTEVFGGALAQIRPGKALNVFDIVRMVSLSVECKLRNSIAPPDPYRFVLQDLNNHRKIQRCSHFYTLVNTHSGTQVSQVTKNSFCCGSFNSTTNACSHSTQGSSAPFSLPVGRIIYNRTSGSTLPNDSETITVTISYTATPTTTLDSSSDPTHHNSPSSSNKTTAVGLGVGVPLGTALLGTLILLWGQRTRARREARAWEEKYDELRKNEKHEGMNRVEGQIQELGGWRPTELDGGIISEGASRMR